MDKYLKIYDNSLELTAIFESHNFRFTRRYNTVGDFEIEAPITEDTLNYYQMGYLVVLNGTAGAGIIEHIRIDQEKGTMTVSGRLLESILDRRIIYPQVYLHGTPAQCIHIVLSQFTSNPADARYLPIQIDQHISLNSSTNTVDATALGDNVLDFISEQAQTEGIGFYIDFKPEETKPYILHIYKGTDRTLASANPLLVSPEAENISNIIIEKDNTQKKTVNYAKTETDIIQSAKGAQTGLERRELFADLSSLKKESSATQATYTAQIKRKALQELSTHTITQGISGDIVDDQDELCLGDLITVKIKDLKITKTMRISEITETFTEAGYSLTPVLTEE